MSGNRLRPHRDEKPMPKSTFTKLKESILMKNTPVEAGRFAAFSPLPMFLVTMFWSVYVTFVLFGKFLGEHGVITTVGLILSLCPLLVSPLLGILGIIHGIMKRKEKRAWLGILLSVLCLAENALLIYAIGYMGVHY